jgi:hypothetical protein
MNELMHCLAMVGICQWRALEDKSKRAEWCAWAEEWNRLAGESLGHSYLRAKARVAGGLREQRLDTSITEKEMKLQMLAVFAALGPRIIERGRRVRRVRARVGPVR